MELSVEQKRALAMASARARMASGTQPETAPEWSGSILPVSRDAQGNVSFDSNAGLLGSLKRAVTLPAEVYRGETPVPNSGQRREDYTSEPPPAGPTEDSTWLGSALGLAPRAWAPSDEGMGRVMDMTGIAMPVNPAVRAADYAIPGARNALVPAKKTRVPTAEELKAAGSAGYDAVRDMGVEYSSGAVAAAAKVAKQALEQDGILGNLAPKTHRIIDDLANPPEGSTASSAGIEAARRAFGNAAKDFNNPTEQLAASRAIDVLDRFVEAPDPTSVVAGPAPAAGKALADARANYAASKRSDTLTGIEDAGDLRAAAANSGQNTDNATRSRLASLLLSPKASRGFTAEELAELRQVAEGTLLRNTARNTGNLLGGGGGLGSVVTGGALGGAGLAAGSPSLAAAGALAPALGVAAKQAGNAMTRRALQRADENTRMRSPLYEQLLEQARTSTNPETYAALMRILTLVGGAEAQAQ